MALLRVLPGYANQCSLQTVAVSTGLTCGFAEIFVPDLCLGADEIDEDITQLIVKALKPTNPLVVIEETLQQLRHPALIREEGSPVLVQAILELMQERRGQSLVGKLRLVDPTNSRYGRQNLEC